MKRVQKLLAAVQSFLDPRAYLHVLRLLHYYNYAHVKQKRKLTLGPGVKMAPNVSLRNAERIRIGARAHIGERCFLWAGANHARIVIEDDALFAPRVFIIASNYQYADRDTPIMNQPRVERDVHIGRDVWLGTNVIVVAGVSVGEGSVVAAGSVVTRDIPPWSVAAGVPAKVIGRRGEDDAIQPGLSSAEAQAG
jgi:acetyltransferase-like isoleucine patch superfamily enzyme